jgi:hypothetical protein
MSDQPSTKEMEVLQKKIQKLAYQVYERRYEKRNHDLGRVLTVTDAALPDPVQRKAVKNLIEQVFYDQFPNNYDAVEEEIKLFTRSLGFELYNEAAKGSPIIEPENKYNDVK